MCAYEWITWNNLKQMFENFNDCLFVLKNVECFEIVHFVPTKLLNLEIYLLKAYMELVQSRISVWLRSYLPLLKSYGRLFIYCKKLLNTDYTMLNIWQAIERLHILLKPNNWLLKSKWKNVYYNWVHFYADFNEKCPTNHLHIFFSKTKINKSFKRIYFLKKKYIPG